MNINYPILIIVFFAVMLFGVFCGAKIKTSVIPGLRKLERVYYLLPIYVCICFFVLLLMPGRTKNIINFLKTKEKMVCIGIMFEKEICSAPKRLKTKFKKIFIKCIRLIKKLKLDILNSRQKLSLRESHNSSDDMNIKNSSSLGLTNHIA